MTASLLLSIGYAYADEQNIEETVVITATRTQQKLENTLSDVTVITPEDIKRSGVKSLPELLSRAPGVQSMSRGGIGTSASLLIRGTASNQSIVLVDGVRQYQTTSGAASYQYIPLDQIDRVEIVRGSASSLYGADAMGGVIQIFTKQPTDAHRQSLGFAMGSNEYYGQQAGAAGKVGILGYQINVSHESSKGFSTQNERLDDMFYTHNPDNDGYRNTTVTGKLDLEWYQGQNLRASFYHGKGNTEYDESMIGDQDDTDFKLKQFAIESANTIIPEKLFSTLTYSEFEDRSAMTNPSSQYFNPPRSHINTKTKNASWLINGKPATGLNLLLGFDWRKDSAQTGPASNPSGYQPDSRENKAVFLGGDWTIQNKHLLESSLRYDDNEQFGSETTGRFAYGFKITPALMLKASYATGFRAPSFSELYYPGYGNPALKAEKNKNTELGITYKGQRINSSWVIFENRIKNAIESIDTGGGLWQAHNIGKARIRGTTVTFDAWITDNLQFKFDATYQEPLDRTNNTVLQSRNRAFGNASLEYKPHEDWTLMAGMHAQNRTRDSYNKDPSGYAIYNVGVRYQITPQITTSVTVDNLLDRRYENIYGYNTPGVGVMWRLNYQN